MKNGHLSPTSVIKNGLLKGISIGAGIGIGLITTTLFAAAAAMKVFSAGEVISAADLNRNLMIAGPEGEVSAFYQTDCPEGWTVADGTNGTPDLRGRFIRGMDNMGIGAAGVDPDGSRAPGDEQLDAFQGHRMARNTAGYSEVPQTIGPGSATNGTGTNGQGIYSTTGDPVTDQSNGTPRTASETRPRNVTLIYCMRKN